ncbi:MAG: DivIVA domain-containing protein [Selenomonadaceae bacterium]|nr:DivIVA domain-containing protein [Selenomonadaceae bacterium]
MLTPMEIHDHQFKKSFRGYSENEVDDFLDKVVDDFERLLKENERLKNQLYSTETELEKYRSLEKTMNDTLIVAQRTADEVISAARKNAEGLKEQAALECQQIRDKAHFEAKQHIDSAIVKRDAILTDYAGLVREKNSFLSKMRTMLESELAITDHVINNLPNIEEKVKTAPPEEKPQAVETPKPPEETSKPAEPPKPEKISKDVEDTSATNIVDISTKPVKEKAVSDETKTYKPVLDKESSQ